MIEVADYAEFLDREYLGSYVRDGGAAVKFVVTRDDEAAAAFSAAVRTEADAAGYVSASVDAATIRVHMMDQVFFDVARQVDWDALATTAVRRALVGASFPVPDDSADVSVETVAAQYGVDAGELSRDVNRRLQQDVQRDYAMVGEFRTAMLRLCQAQLQTGQVTDAEHAAVLDWLTGDLRQISALRSAMIFRRIGRHNGRQMLFSLSHWLFTNGMAGLFLQLDIRRLGFARRPRAEERSGVYYTRPALLDAYELLRQLIDNTDELSHCCVVVLASREILADPNRGINAYQALKLRIHDEVRDRNRDNPFSSLVRLGSEAA
ncbi:MAG: ATP-binding protein [Actinomycetota bacterium]|nr:ATP-binding protein [Actinomycetota bacterium]